MFTRTAKQPKYKFHQLQELALINSFGTLKRRYGTISEMEENVEEWKYVLHERAVRQRGVAAITCYCYGCHQPTQFNWYCPSSIRSLWSRSWYWLLNFEFVLYFVLSFGMPDATGRWGVVAFGLVWRDKWQLPVSIYEYGSSPFLVIQ